MPTVRMTALLVIVASLALGLALDRVDRMDRMDLPDAGGLPADVGVALASTTAGSTTWFCPGGSGRDRGAELVIELLSVAAEPRRATVTIAPGGPVAVEGSSFDLEIEPGDRLVLEPADRAERAVWVGAVVEVDGPDVIVEQSVVGEVGGVGRSPCLTRTATRWIVADGATRSTALGERFIVMMLNPFPDDAVVDIEFVADVGSDSLEGVVVPASEVVGIDVTDEVPVAGHVAVLVNVVAGRVAVSRIQLADSPTTGSGVRIAPATPEGALLWYLPSSAIGPGRRDLVAVANPSFDLTAEVDLEILTYDPESTAEPIALTVRPRRSVTVDLSSDVRLANLGSFTVLVRSEAPVAASLDSVVLEGMGQTGGMTALAGADAAARRWLAPVVATLPGEDFSLVIVNPSRIGIALVDLLVDSEVVSRLELAPGRRVRIDPDELPAETSRPVVEVEASLPVVVGREHVGLTSRSAALGIAISPPVPLLDVP